ncbi:MAG: SIR2 family protein [Anaerolineales bacterium]|nr:SIR2 family protein [Anaerolineales bacterium]WKZ40921.1 MAG: SIR2 family protein [Anaerolineales bacterium]
MNLQEGIEFALSGKSILFIGAGFSVDAQNLRGVSFKTGRKLAKHLAELSGITGTQLDEISLDDAAEEYISANGKDKLIDELHNEFTAKVITSAQSVIAGIPWKRIYTTNYDNVMEKAYSENGKKLVPVTINDNIRDIPELNTLCVHLNGYIDRLDRNTLTSEFKLTETSYLTSSIEDTSWVSLFRTDIKSAQSVFFVGYSLADLDIKRILMESEALKEKCFFVIGSPGKATINSCSKFGEITGLDTSSFSVEVKTVSKNYVPPIDSGFSSSVIEKYIVPVEKKEYLDKDLFSLFLQGYIDTSYLVNSLNGEIKYFLERPQLGFVLEQIRYEQSVIVIHSELGNGKSLLLEGIKYRASQAGFNVYTLLENSDDILEQIDSVFHDSGKKIIIIENYTDWMEPIRHISQISDDRCSVILTSRTSLHDVNIDRLSEMFPDLEVKEIPVDNLTDLEIKWFANVFDEFGLWGEHKNKSWAKKLEFLSVNCGGEFQGILLELLKSPNIISKLETIIENIKHKKSYYQILITIMVLNTLNKTPSIERLIDYWGNQILDSNFKQDAAVRQLIDFQKNSITFKSSVTAKHILRNVVDVKTLADVLIKLMQTSNRLAKPIQFHFDVKNLLMRFSSLQELLPKNNSTKSEIIRYYATIKNFNTINNYPLFWLQYAIACEVLEEFEQTEKYFQTAYSLADDLPWFDTFQIDNRYAEFLINRAVKEKRNIQDAMSDFVEAHRLIHIQAKKERLHFPFKVASLYESFYDMYSVDMQTKHVETLQKAASDVITRINMLPKERQKDWRIRKCQNSLYTLLQKTSQ